MTIIHYMISTYDKQQSNVKLSSVEQYEEFYNRSISPLTRDAFWEEQAKEVTWHQFPKIILDESNAPFYNWFKDGKLNMCYNCLDRHIENNHGNDIALIWETGYSNEVHKYSYNDLYIEVSKLSKILIKLGVKKLDTIIIYMPVICEAIITMLACWRIGAIHSVVFGGFAACELADRIKNAKPKLLITASAGVEPRKKINYFNNVIEALNLANAEAKDVGLLLYQRENVFVIPKEDLMKYPNVSIYNEMMSQIDDTVFVEPVELNSNDPMYILYTSGTTGSPKGIVRDLGGCAVTANFTMKYIMNVTYGDVVFSSSDIGWIVGHLFMVYGPLIRGATSILFEGKPVGTPNCGKCFELIQKYRVKVFYSCPTAIRAIKKEDPDCLVISQYDLSSLESVALAGERCDPDTFNWIQNAVGKNKLINDHWWQTESGYPICCNNINIHRFPSKAGVPGKPIPGFDVNVLNTETLKPITEPFSNGLVCIKLPTPPSFMTTLWNNNQAYVIKYLTEDKQYYVTNDIGCWDNEGNITILSRKDDMIKIAGHRLTTGHMEEIIMKIKEISEAAVISVADELKGELPFAFVVVKDLKEGYDKKKLTDSVKNIIANEIGAISRLKEVCIVPALPKTRSGKIIRPLLKSIMNCEKYVIPSTIEDSSVIDVILSRLKEDKFI